MPPCRPPDGCDAARSNRCGVPRLTDKAIHVKHHTCHKFSGLVALHSRRTSDSPVIRGTGGVGAGDCEPSDTRAPPPSFFPACAPTEATNGDSLDNAGDWLSRSWLQHPSQQDPNQQPRRAPLQEGSPASATCRGFGGSAPIRAGRPPNSS